MLSSRSCVVHYVRAFAILGGVSLTASLLVTQTQAGAPTATSITSSGLGTVVTPNGAMHSITGGTRPSNGPNLFHSFGDFILKAGDTADFSNHTGLATSNIIARVTGGKVSDIYGTIQTTGFGTASVFLINPFGVVFGPTASLNVGGSVHITTANYLKMGSSQFFAYLDGATTKSTLTTDPISAFGFFGATPPADLPRPILSPALITVQGGVLQVPKGQALSIIGGDFQMTGGRLAAPSGQVMIANVGSSGEVIPSLAAQPLGLQVASFSQLGQATLSGNALVSTSDPAGVTGSGTVLIRGGKLTLDNAIVSGTTPGTSDGAAVAADIRMRDTVDLTNGARLQTQTLGAGKAGEVYVETATLRVKNAATLATSTSGPGTGGTITLKADQAEILNGGTILTTGSNALKAGKIDVEAATLRIKNDAKLQTLNAGGNVTVKANQLEILDGGTLFASALSNGPSSNVTVMADQVLISAGNKQGCCTGIRGQVGISGIPTSGRGGGGLISVTANDLTILGSPSGSAEISATAFGEGPGGILDVTAAGMLSIGGGTPLANSTLLTGIFTNTSASGRGADLRVTAGSLQLADNTVIQTRTTGPGPGGDATVMVSGTLDVREGAVIATDSTSGL